MSRSLSCIRATTALAAVAVVVAGCAAANNATSSQGASQGEQPYKTGYGFSSDGPTTDLYTELFGSPKPAAQPATAAVATQPVQPVTASATTQPVQPATTTAATRQAKPAMASATPRQVQPAPAPVEVAQQPAPPQPPPEPDGPAAYGITANGPTTDLYTVLFGPRRSDGQ
ncbi:MAG: hypothetical protein ACLQDM_25255 [Bradyrhizobium sp.]